MKVLIVISGNKNSISPFVLEQVKAINDLNVETNYFFIRGKGFYGYLRNFTDLRKKVNKYQPDLIHAHFGLSALLANLQRKIPVVNTFHGSDINDIKNRKYSKIAALFANQNIFVDQKMLHALPIKDANVIPCGVDLNIFQPMKKSQARKQMGLGNDKILILFSSSFSNYIKNYPLAKKAISIIKDKNIKLFELKGYKREEVVTLMNAVDIALLTSFSEGSPQFIKESMACNIPIVSTDVGDINELIGRTEGCFITSNQPDDVANKIKDALAFGKRTNGRKKIIDLELDSQSIAKRVINVYNDALKM